MFKYRPWKVEQKLLERNEETVHDLGVNRTQKGQASPGLENKPWGVLTLRSCACCILVQKQEGGPPDLAPHMMSCFPLRCGTPIWKRGTQERGDPPPGRSVPDKAGRSAVMDSRGRPADSAARPQAPTSGCSEPGCSCLLHGCPHPSLPPARG